MTLGIPTVRSLNLRTVDGNSPTLAVGDLPKAELIKLDDFQPTVAELRSIVLAPAFADCGERCASD